MRIFELAKELNTTPRDLLRQAKALNLEVRTTVSSLFDADDEKALRDGFKARISLEVADDESALRHLMEEKSAAAAEIFKDKLSAESEKLAAAIARTREIEAEIKAKSACVAVETAKAEAAVVEPVAEPVAKADPVVETVVSPGAVVPQVVVAPEKTEPKAEPKPVEVVESKPLESKSVEPAKVAEPAKPAEPVVPSVKVSTEPKTTTIKTKRAPRPFYQEDDEEATIPPVLHGKHFDDDEVGRPVRHQTRDEDIDDRRHGPAQSKRDARLGRSVRQDGKRAVAPSVTSIDSKTISLHGPVIVKDLADRLGVRANVVITELMKRGILASINQSVDQVTASSIAQNHGFKVEVEQHRSKRNADNHPVMRRVDADDDIPDDRPEDMVARPPVVTFLGHVDHGKTSLMDRIRSSSVAAGEAGGITQHIGAYSVEVAGQTITFLDTPGHAAFSAMRARGANLTDIAVIIVAADDGIMPQTKEAIRYAKEADVSIMVAINKMDLPQANPDRVLQQLQAEKLTPEEWGGDVVVCRVSAATGAGVDNLLDMILLQAEVLELRANPKRRANGTVIEAQMEPGRGPTASVLVTGGTLAVGDIVLCGETYGRIKALITPTGSKVQKAGPSMAVRIMGLSGVPEAGSEFRVMPNAARAKELAEEYAEHKKEEILGVTPALNADDIFRKMHDAEKLELHIILRADVQGSVEAIEEAVRQIKSDKVGCSIIHAGTGNITSTDIQTAGSGAAIILGFHVSPEAGVSNEARHFGVRIKTFRIIYELLDFIQSEMLNLLPVEHRELVKGHALVKQVFSISKKGTVAGCSVENGSVLVSGHARVIRAKKVIHTGTFTSLKHFKDEVKEVAAGQECGIRISGFEEYNEGDVIECFILEALPKTL